MLQSLENSNKSPAECADDKIDMGKRKSRGFKYRMAKGRDSIDLNNNGSLFLGEGREAFKYWKRFWGLCRLTVDTARVLRGYDKRPMATRSFH